MTRISKLGVLCGLLEQLQQRLSMAHATLQVMTVINYNTLDTLRTSFYHNRCPLDFLDRKDTTNSKHQNQRFSLRHRKKIDSRSQKLLSHMRFNKSRVTDLCDFKLISTRTWVEVSLWFFVVFKVFYFHFVVKNGHFGFACVSRICRNSAKQPGLQQTGEGWALIRMNFRRDKYSKNESIGMTSVYAPSGSLPHCSC